MTRCVTTSASWWVQSLGGAGAAAAGGERGTLRWDRGGNEEPGCASRARVRFMVLVSLAACTRSWQTRISSLFQGHVRILLDPALVLLDQLLMSSSAEGLTRAGAAHALGGECWCPADLDGCQPPAQAVPPGWRLWTPKHARGKHRGFPRPQSRAPGSCWAQAPHGPAPAAGRSRVSPSPCTKGPLSQGPLVPMHRALWLEAELGHSGRCLPLPASPSQESPEA